MYIMITINAIKEEILDVSPWTSFVGINCGLPKEYLLRVWAGDSVPDAYRYVNYTLSVWNADLPVHWVSMVLARSWRSTQSSGGNYWATWAHWALPQVDTCIKPTKQLSNYHIAIFYTQNFWNKYFFQTKSLCLMWKVLRNFGDMVIQKRKNKENLGSCDILKVISHPCKLKGNKYNVL